MDSFGCANRCCSGGRGGCCSGARCATEKARWLRWRRLDAGCRCSGGVAVLFPACGAAVVLMVAVSAAVCALVATARWLTAAM
ncbi:hypothetical protein DEO72_LG6g1280 [Vigna unguiculata]|uniref:Uncharacterized protein n=1 Tax=Vigna unguiculata TaxID=3917 RepID=A0A4D6M9S1_VIGUN|nr:hypothetical protein DEO72_LG6g1280 [Vigna unguiculata]